MSGFDEPWKQSWAREADKVKDLAENNAHLRAALVKAEEKCDTWRQRAEEAEEVAGDLRSKRLHEAMAAEQSIIAAERTVREQREALERIVSYGHVRGCSPFDVMDDCAACTASSALAPDTEGES